MRRWIGGVADRGSVLERLAIVLALGSATLTSCASEEEPPDDAGPGAGRSGAGTAGTGAAGRDTSGGAGNGGRSSDSNAGGGAGAGEAGMSEGGSAGRSGGDAGDSSGTGGRDEPSGNGGADAGEAGDAGQAGQAGTTAGQAGQAGTSAGSAGVSGSGGSTAEDEPCYPNPCANHGACVEQTSGIACDCAAGFSGPRCETNEGIHFVEMAADFQACGILSNGSIDCRGSSRHGQASPPPGEFVDIAVAGQTTCAVRNSGTLVCFGDETGGKAHPPEGSFAHVSGFGAQFCGLRTNGEVACWGEAGSTIPILPGTFTQISVNVGVCGIRASDGTIACSSDSLTPEPLPTEAYAQVASGWPTACAVTSAGSMTCWGGFFLSMGGIAKAVASFRTFGLGEACAVFNSGALTCWQKLEIAGPPIPPATSFAGSYVDLTFGDERTCALSTDGTLACSDHFYYENPTEPTGSFVDVTAWDGLPCGLRADGSVSCPLFYDGAERSYPGPYAQIDGLPYSCNIDRDGHVAPTLAGLFAPDGVFSDVAKDYSGLCCGIDQDHSLRCWSDSAELEPPIAGTYVDVEGSAKNRCAIDTNGELACWGSNSYGQSEPPPGSFVALSTGPNHACALRTNGEVACWGRDDNGEATPPPGKFTRISAGSGHTCGVRASGHLACWGANGSGQSAPPEGTFTRVSAGGLHTCAIATDGEMICFGERRTAYGRLTALP